MVGSAAPLRVQLAVWMMGPPPQDALHILNQRPVCGAVSSRDTLTIVMYPTPQSMGGSIHCHSQ